MGVIRHCEDLPAGQAGQYSSDIAIYCRNKEIALTYPSGCFQDLDCNDANSQQVYYDLLQDMNNTHAKENNIS